MNDASDASDASEPFFSISRFCLCSVISPSRLKKIGMEWNSLTFFM